MTYKEKCAVSCEWCADGIGICDLVDCMVLGRHHKGKPWNDCTAPTPEAYIEELEATLNAAQAALFRQGILIGDQAEVIGKQEARIVGMNDKIKRLDRRIQTQRTEIKNRVLEAQQLRTYRDRCASLAWAALPLDPEKCRDSVLVGIGRLADHCKQQEARIAQLENALLPFAVDGQKDTPHPAFWYEAARKAMDAK